MQVYESTRELRIACKHDDLLPSLREYDPHREICEIEYGIPVKRFCRGTEKTDLTHTEDDVRGWRILLTVDVSVAEIPVELLKKQDMVLVYRTNSEEQLAECVRPLFSLQKREPGEAVCHPAVLCFANVDAAKEFIRFIGWQMLADVQVIDIDFNDVIKAFASQRGNILCISKKNLFPQEKLSAQDAEIQGALLIFRGAELSLYDVCTQAEKLCSSFHESADIIWIIIECHEQSVTALLATRLTDQGIRPRNEL
ncbi:hypothetical protein [uncultured Selenomonas sp.]|uniref:hypothetical protein n=1 Tax=uncultured Selenomonas sp. TaxID=159275 RepID=UPI00267756CE|nr:hypothetical protein [uncultured Selenomonas sp.]